MFVLTAEAGQRRHKQAKYFDFSVMFLIWNCILFGPRVMQSFHGNMLRQSYPESLLRNQSQFHACSISIRHHNGEWKSSGKEKTEIMSFFPLRNSACSLFPPK